MADLFAPGVTTADKRAEIAREQASRRAHWPQWVKMGHLDEDRARRALEVMAAIEDDYALMLQTGRPPVAITLARVRTDWDRDRAALVFDTRVDLADQMQPRVVELRMAVTPYELAALIREASLILAQMDPHGRRRDELSPASDWLSTIGAAA